MKKTILMGKAASNGSTETALTQQHQTIKQKMRNYHSDWNAVIFTWSHNLGSHEWRWARTFVLLPALGWRSWNPTVMELLRFYLAAAKEPQGPSYPNPSEFKKSHFSLWNQLCKSGMSILQRNQQGTFMNFSKKEPGRQRLMGLWEQRPGETKAQPK